MPGDQEAARPGSVVQDDSAGSLNDLLRRHQLQPDDADRLQQILAKIPESDPAHGFAWGTWAGQLAQYRVKASGNQFATGALAIVSLFFVVPLPLLTGLGALVGSGASWLRWMTFGLTLGAALTGRFVHDRAYGPRWFLYHRYTESLFEEGQLYAERAGPYDPGQSTPPLDDISIKNLFVTRVTKLQNDMANQYDQIVTLASAGGANLAPKS
jgi:hypothetical protein